MFFIIPASWLLPILLVAATITGLVCGAVTVQLTAAMILRNVRRLPTGVANVLIGCATMVSPRDTIYNCYAADVFINSLSFGFEETIVAVMFLTCLWFAPVLVFPAFLIGAMSVMAIWITDSFLREVVGDGRVDTLQNGIRAIMS